MIVLKTDGKITYCNAFDDDEEKECDYVDYQRDGESGKDFIKRIAKDLIKYTSLNCKEDILNLDYSEKLKMINNHENLDIFMMIVILLFVKLLPSRVMV